MQSTSFNPERHGEQYGTAPVRDGHWSAWIGLGIAALALGLYARTLGFDFVAFDDIHYVVSNPAIAAGIDAASLRWAFTASYDATWFPLTYISHALDIDLYGLNPAGHHATSVLLHALNSALVFLALQALTGARWRSACVGVLFALHPLHVESVAWVAERKDVLSSAFGFGAILCYAGYVRSPTLLRAGAVFAAFAASLMAKPMWVTLPFLLLLLDAWPLRRIPGGGQGRGRRVAGLLLEKLPLVALSVLSSLQTLRIQAEAGATATAANVSLSDRVSNAVVSIALYLRRVVWPSDLSPHYPHPFVPELGGEPLGSLQILGASALVAAVTLGVWLSRRGALRLGWCWFLGMLVPVLGFVQVGAQAMADRYVYAPITGVFVAIVWGGAELVSRAHSRSAPLLRAGGAALALAVISMAVLTWQQLDHWRDSRSLFEHALALDPRDQTMRFALAEVERADRNLEAALRHARLALEVDSNSARAHNAIGLAYKLQGRFREAADQFERALELQPELSLALNNLGNVRRQLGEDQRAEAAFRRALAVRPRYPVAELNLAELLAETGRPEEAEQRFRRVTSQKPESVRAWRGLGRLLEGRGQAAAAAAAYRKVLLRVPDQRLARRIARLEAEAGAP